MLLGEVGIERERTAHRGVAPAGQDGQPFDGEATPADFLRQRQQNIESDGRIEVRLRALPDRQLVVRVTSVDGACKAETFLTIDGKQAYLEKVFVFAEEGLILPTVRYIELFGHGNDGIAVYEKIAVDG